ncbi:TIGR04338 family metallohydrolase [Nocardia sp. CNY236]|uniref:TIGR04338 family metallohydrolase n=1 Tax=Nocardia sp. CNY236 TaxID=1169152 RepID=UPI00048E43AF|nr:TIGR04338 family metallohydrolase [Nocardia sp. CNY236]
MSVRDTQRAQVYDAEHLVRGVFDRADQHRTRTIELYGSQVTLPIERRFASVESVQDYVCKVLALHWIRLRWHRAAVPVRVRARNGTTAAHYEGERAVIAVPTHTGASVWALRELVVLHELAHHLEPAPATVAPHGSEFCCRYIDLVDGIVGPEAGLLLRTTMLGCGVRLG